MKFIRADKFFQRLFPWSRLQLAPAFLWIIESLPSCPHPIRQNLISNIKYPDPYKRPFLIPYSSFPWLLKIASGIILRPKERERRHKDHDNHQRKNRVQSAERYPGENNRKKQDQPSPYGRSQRIINRIKKREEKLPWRRQEPRTKRNSLRRLARPGWTPWAHRSGPSRLGEDTKITIFNLRERRQGSWRKLQNQRKKKHSRA